MLICVLSCLLLAGCALSDGGDASIANTDGTESRFDGAQAQNPGSASAEHMESTGGVPQDTSSSNLSLAENADSLTMEINPSQAALSDKEFLLTFRNSEDTQFYYGLEYTLEHYDGGEWKSVGFEVSPAYPDGNQLGDFGAFGETYVFTIINPEKAYGIRLIGTPGGYQKLISCAEMEVYKEEERI